MPNILQKVLIFAETSFSQTQTQKKLDLNTKTVILLQATYTWH